ncbi:MAG: hypothetical protein R3224_05415, partial [Balneolaceae bacterium]|nr:hypothetical protein [Balneolaceae bacterium]
MAVFACRKSSPTDNGGAPPAPDPEDPMQVDSSGGSVSNEDSTVVLDIPSGSLSSEVTFTIGETTSHPGNAVGTVYDIGPDGTLFDPPATLILEYE